MTDEINQLGTSRYSWFAPWMGVPVCTSVGLPRWMPGIDFVTGLKPVGIFRIEDRNEFTEKYLARLQVWESRIHADLLRLSEKWPGQRLILLCYEDITQPGVWCHRSIAADWLRAHGLTVTEMPRYQYEMDSPVVAKEPPRPPAVTTTEVMPPPLF